MVRARSLTVRNVLHVAVVLGVRFRVQTVQRLRFGDLLVQERAQIGPPVLAPTVDGAVLAEVGVAVHILRAAAIVPGRRRVGGRWMYRLSGRCGGAGLWRCRLLPRVTTHERGAERAALHDVSQIERILQLTTDTLLTPAAARLRR